MQTNYRTIKVIQDYPFSKVEIVELNKKKYILKSVPEFFAEQPKRQKYLSNKCKKSLIPKIHRMKKNNGRIYFLMDYIKSTKNTLQKQVYIDHIKSFHQETINCKSNLFPIYDFSIFKYEFKKIKKLIPLRLFKQLNNHLKLFKNTFDGQISVVHGDWVPAQLIGNGNKYFIIDFEMSFIGPSILDHAHFFIKDKSISPKFLKLMQTDKKAFLNARIVEALRKLGWVINCMESGHTTYKFKPEIKTYTDILERLIKVLQTTK